MKNSYRKYKVKVSAPTWDENFELRDRSYSVSDIQNYWVYYQEHETLTEKSPIQKICQQNWE